MAKTQEYTVEMSDGAKVTIAAPEGTAPDVIKRNAAIYYQQSKASQPSSQSPMPASTPADDYFKSKQTAQIAANAPATIGPTQHGIGQTIYNVMKHTLVGRPVDSAGDIMDYFNMSTNDKLADLSGITRDLAGMATGAAAGLALGPEMAPSGATIPGILSTGWAGLASSGTMATMDQILRKATGQGTGSTLFPNSPTGASVVGTAENEAGAKVLNVAGKGLSIAKRGITKALTSPGVTGFVKGVTNELLNLLPTYGQFNRSVTGVDHFEDLLATNAKISAVQESANRAVDRLKEIVKDLTMNKPRLRRRFGKVVTDAPTNEEIAMVMQGEVKRGFQTFLDASNQEAETAKLIAGMNPTSVPTGTSSVTSPIVNPSLPINPATGLNFPQVTPNPPKIISGAINTGMTLQSLADYADTVAHSKVAPDPMDRVTNTIKEFFENTNAVFTDGKLTSYTPMSFEEAWNTKQAFDKLGYGHLTENLNVADSKFREISRSLTNDIEQSMTNKNLWPNKPADALKAFQNARTIVGQRHEIFTPLSESGASMDTLLSTVNAPDPAVGAIMDDHQKLSRFILKGEYKIGTKKVFSDNAKNDARAYVLQDIFNKNRTLTNPSDPNAVLINGKGLVDDFRAFRNSQSGKILFGSPKTPSPFDEFIDAAVTTSSMPSAGFAERMHINLATRSVAVGAGFISGSLAGGSTTGAITGTAFLGGVVSMSQVAKVLTNKKAAPILLSMLHGRPLGMSYQMAFRSIIQAMRGSTLTLLTKDGKSQEATIGTDGYIRPVAPRN